MKFRLAGTGGFLAGFSLALSAGVIAGTVTLPNTFTANTQAKASEVNANFTAVKTAVDENHTRLSTVETTVTRLTGIEATVNGGNIVLAPSTDTAGNIFKGSHAFLHDFGSNNVFLGLGTGNFAMSGANNTGIGGGTLQSNTTGRNNVATGAFALFSNTTGEGNTALGHSALTTNSTGNNNTASGLLTLSANTVGVNNTAVGVAALTTNVDGVNNTAIGVNALLHDTSGSRNTAIGVEALSNPNGYGNDNIAIGYRAGDLFSRGGGGGNIFIGNRGNGPIAGAIYIGQPGLHIAAFIAGISGTSLTGVPVLVDNQGRLGTATSSIKVKDHVSDMEEASRVLEQLRPVTFYYKSDKGSPRTLQYGLVAEEVAKVAPGLVAHDANGAVQTVYYQFLAPMLLNEYQKQQRTIAAQAAEIAGFAREREAQLARISALEEQAARTMASLARLEQTVSTPVAAR